MTQEEKQLLLIDLSARLPYHVKIHTWYGEVVTSDLNTFPFSMDEMDEEEDLASQLSGIKPYLRSISSMTEEEKKEYDKLIAKCIYDPEAYFFDNYNRLYDWLLSHHFDFRGLIEKGLALEAPEGMY